MGEYDDAGIVGCPLDDHACELFWREYSGMTEEIRGANQIERAAIEFAPPSPETIPGSQLGEQIRLGYQIVIDTQDYAKPYVGNRLNCTNCHLDGGLNPNAASFVGLASVYPEYRSRNAEVNTLADRINECFERSLNGRALPPDSSKLQAVVASITSSQGVLSTSSTGRKYLRANAFSVTARTGRERWPHRLFGDPSPTTLPQAWRG